MSALILKAKRNWKFNLFLLACATLVIGLPFVNFNQIAKASNPEIQQSITVLVDGDELEHADTTTIYYREGETTIPEPEIMGTPAGTQWQYSNDGGQTWLDELDEIPAVDGSQVIIRLVDENGVCWEAIINIEEIEDGPKKESITWFTAGIASEPWAHTRSPSGFPELGDMDGTLYIIRDPKTGMYNVELSVHVFPGSGYDPTDFGWRIRSTWNTPRQFPTSRSGIGSETPGSPFEEFEIPAYNPLIAITGNFVDNGDGEGSASISIDPTLYGEGPYIIELTDEDDSTTYEDEGDKEEYYEITTSSQTCASCSECDRSDVSLDESPLTIPTGDSGSTSDPNDPQTPDREKTCEVVSFINMDLPELYDPSVSEITNPGLSALKVLTVPDGLKVTTDANGNLSTVEGGRKFIFSSVTGGTDPNHFKVEAFADPSGANKRYLTVEVEQITDGGVKKLKVTDTYHNLDGTGDSVRTAYFWKETVGNTVISKLSSHNGGRELHRAIKPDTVNTTAWVETRTVYEKTATGGTLEKISEVAQQWRRYAVGAAKLEKIIKDPAGRALTTTIHYYDKGQPTGGPLGVSTAGAGQVKSIRSYDGGKTSYHYTEDTSSLNKPYGNEPAGETKEHKIGRETLASASNLLGAAVNLATEANTPKFQHSVIRSISANGSSSILETSASQFGGGAHVVREKGVTSAIVFKPANSVSAPRRIERMIHSDGSLTTLDYQWGNGNKTVIIENGEPDAAEQSVQKGTRTSITTSYCLRLFDETVDGFNAPGNFVRLRSRHVLPADFDELGRPTKMLHNSTAANHPDNELYSFGCCGVNTYKGRDGKKLTYFHDSLGRRKLTHVQRGASGPAVFYGTVYDGLTVASTRNGITTSKSQRNLAGETIKSWAADADGDGDLELTEMSYEYNLKVNNIVNRVTTDYPDGSQSIVGSYADGRISRVYGTANTLTDYIYGTHSLNGGGTWTQVIRLTSEGGANEWTKTYEDSRGRTFRVEYSDGALATMEYHTEHDLLLKSTDPDGVITEYNYHPDGSRKETITHLPNNQQRVDRREYGYQDKTFGSETATRGSVWIESFSNNVKTSTTWSSGDGYASQSDSFGRISHTIRTIADTDGNWHVTSTTPEGVKSRQYYEDGLPVTSLAFEDGTTPPALAPLDITTYAAAGFISGSSTAYDDIGRPLGSTDSRTGTTDYDEDNDNLPDVTESGNPLYMRDATGNVTRFAYDTMGRRITITLPDGSTTHTSYTPRGEALATWGSQTYARLYRYDAQGRMIELRTYQDLAHGTEPTLQTGGAAVTRWSYDPQRGWLTEKNYAGETGNGPGNSADYAYTSAGRLQTRTWERGVSTTYTYTSGLLTLVDYSDTTLDVTYTYDSFGRPSVVTQGGNSHTYSYNPANLLLDDETIAYDTDANGTADFTRTLKRHRDTLLRPLSKEIAGEYTTGYGYDTAARLNRVWNHPALDAAKAPQSNADFAYGYLARSYAMVEDVTRTGGHTVLNSYEANRNVLLSKNNHTGNTAAPVSKYNYASAADSAKGVNSLGQRTRRTVSGSAFSTIHTTDWKYNPRGELETEDNTADDAGDRNRAYTYDGIGNRQQTGTAFAYTGNILSITTPQSYTANDKNQYTAVPDLTAAPLYDLDGNATSYPLPESDPGTAATLTWDAENRLITATVSTDGSTVTISYEYDYMSRRIAKTTVGSPATSTLYLYDGWNLLAEYTGTTLKKTYTWGIDLSGSMQGAGGVGGLLAVTEHIGGNTNHYYPTYDGNGNVSEYLDSSNTVQAHYEYDPFGKTTVATGTKKYDFAHRFSTKSLDSETGLYYYGYRYYDPNVGRWLSRDPVEENFDTWEFNVYVFVSNDGINHWDFLGQWKSKDWWRQFFVPVGPVVVLVDGLFVKYCDCMCDEILQEFQRNIGTIHALKKVLKEANEDTNGDGLVKIDFRAIGVMGGDGISHEDERNSEDDEDCPEADRAKHRKEIRGDFESLGNIGGYASALSELGMRLSSGVQSNKGTITNDKAKKFAKAMIKRQAAYHKFLSNLLITECK